MIRSILILILLALPMGVLADTTNSQRPESGSVTYVDLESRELEINDAEFTLTAGVKNDDKIKVGQTVTVHFTQVGDTKMVDEVVIEDQDD